MNESPLLRLVALVAFVSTYLGLALGHVPGLRVDRAGIAIIGATVMIVGGVIRWDQAVAAVDAHTLVLLFGMMVVTAYLRLSGFFALVTAWMIRRTTTPVGLLAAIVVTSGVNDVVILFRQEREKVRRPDVAHSCENFAGRPSPRPPTSSPPQSPTPPSRRHHRSWLPSLLISPEPSRSRRRPSEGTHLGITPCREGPNPTKVG
jgi:hypothetical protein